MSPCFQYEPMCPLCKVNNVWAFTRLYTPITHICLVDKAAQGNNGF